MESTSTTIRRPNLAAVKGITTHRQALLNAQEVFDSAKTHDERVMLDGLSRLTNENIIKVAKSLDITTHSSDTKSYKTKATFLKDILERYQLDKDNLQPDWMNRAIGSKADTIFREPSEVWDKTKSKDELFQKAKSLGLPATTKMTKGKLIALIQSDVKAPIEMEPTPADNIKPEDIIPQKPPGVTDEQWETICMKRKIGQCPHSTTTSIHIKPGHRKAEIVLQEILPKDLVDAVSWAFKRAISEKELYPVVVDRKHHPILKTQNDLESGFSALVEGWENYRVHITVSAHFDVTSFTDRPKKVEGFHPKQLPDTYTVSRALPTSRHFTAFSDDAKSLLVDSNAEGDRHFIPTLRRWWNGILNDFETLVARSDLYAIVSLIDSLQIKFRLVPLFGRGYVRLLKPELFLEIYNPVDNTACFYQCVEESPFKWKASRQDAIVQTKSNARAVNIKMLSKLVEHLVPKCRIILHKAVARQNSFTVRIHDCGRYPREPQEGGDLHLGYTDGHFFYIRDTAVLERLKITDFEVINNSLVDKSLSITEGMAIKTSPIATARKALISASEELSAKQISDKTLKNRIKSYKDQDKEKLNLQPFEESDYIDIETIRELFKNPVCHLCNVLLQVDTWEVDRDDSSIAHVKSNCKLACRHCNRAKGKRPSALHMKKEREFYLWDIETYVDGNGDFKVYNVGVLRSEPQLAGESELEWGQRLADKTKTFYGLTAWEQFENYVFEINDRLVREVTRKLDSWMQWCQRENLLDDIDSRKKARINNLIMENRVIFIAHNGGRFDNQFVFKSKRFQFEKVIDLNGIISLRLLDGLVEFRDSIRMTGPQGLDELCESYRLPAEWRKTSFPHAFANEKTLDYIGEVPDASYWPNGKIPEEHIGKPFDFKATSLSYQKLDCISLCIVWAKLDAAMFTATERHIIDYLTLPALASDFVLTNTPVDDIRMITDPCIDAYIREAIRGGRCFCQRKRFVSKYNDAIQKALTDDNQQELESLFNACDDYLVDYDGVSLYPSSMALFNYPIGEPYWETDLKGLEARLNTKTDEKEQPYFGERSDEILPNDKFPLGIITCTVDFPRKDLPCPLLSTKSQLGNLMYTWEKKDIVATTIDLMESVRYNGCIVSNVTRGLMWPSRRASLRKPIEGLFFGRREAKSKGLNALQLSCKNAMNSSFGSMIERIKDVKTELLSIHQEAKHEPGLTRIDELYQTENVILDTDLVNDNQSIIEYSNNPKIKRPAHIGVFILAFSKVIMNRAINAFDGFTNWDKTFYYTDTDSLHIHVNQMKEVGDKLPDTVVKVEGNGELGQLDNDIKCIKNGKIIRAYFIRPKVYCDEVFGKDKDGKFKVKYHMRIKGMPSAAQKTLTMNDFESMANNYSLPEFSSNEFKRSMKDNESAPIRLVQRKKVINKTLWNGRLYDEATGIFLPLNEQNVSVMQSQLKEFRK